VLPIDEPKPSDPNAPDAKPPIRVARKVPLESLPDSAFDYVEDNRPRMRKRKPPRITALVRSFLALMAVACGAVLAIAAWIHPYDETGEPYSMATHTQLGMPPCNMVVMSGKPCPACGMTTSFSLLAHGDPLASMQANWVGTFLAIFAWSLIPWGLACAIRGRLVWVKNPELTLTIILSILLVLMVGRWIVIMVTPSS